MADQRRQYRTAPPFRDLVSITVVRPGQTDVPGTVEDMAIGGLGVFVEAASDADFQVDETIHLRLTSPWLDHPISTTGTIRSQERTVLGTRYGIEFLDWLGLLPQLPATLKALFNQRTGRRLGFRHHPEIEVEGLAGEFRFTAKLLNLSATGLGFILPESSEGGPAENDQIIVTLTVPGTSEKLTFCCHVRDRKSQEDRVSIHVAFVQEGTVGFEQKCNRLAHLIREMEQRARERAAAKPAGPTAPRD